MSVRVLFPLFWTYMLLFIKFIPDKNGCFGIAFISLLIGLLSFAILFNPFKLKLLLLLFIIPLFISGIGVDFGFPPNSTPGIGVEFAGLNSFSMKFFSRLIGSLFITNGFFSPSGFRLSKYWDSDIGVSVAKIAPGIDINFFSSSSLNIDHIVRFSFILICISPPNIFFFGIKFVLILVKSFIFLIKKACLFSSFALNLLFGSYWSIAFKNETVSFDKSEGTLYVPSSTFETNSFILYASNALFPISIW